MPILEIAWDLTKNVSSGVVTVYSKASEVPSKIFSVLSKTEHVQFIPSFSVRLASSCVGGWGVAKGAFTIEKAITNKLGKKILIPATIGIIADSYTAIAGTFAANPYILYTIPIATAAREYARLNLINAIPGILY